MADRELSVSVCMATYRGAAYVGEQIASILPQLGAGDELVVVDDAGGDDTVAIVAAIGDPRIRVHRNPENLGYVRTFERAIGLAVGDVVVLADQDDLWPDGRVDAMAHALRQASVVAGNVALLPDGAPLPSPIGGGPWRLRSADEAHGIRNTLGILTGTMPYYGSAMAFRADFREVVLPFPAWLTESHDLWIALAGNAAHAMRHLDEPVVLRRVHGENASASKPRALPAVLASRWMLLRAAVVVRRRVRRARRAQAAGGYTRSRP